MLRESSIESSPSIRLASTVSFNLPKRSAMLPTFSGEEGMVVGEEEDTSTPCVIGDGGVRSNRGRTRSGQRNLVQCEAISGRKRLGRLGVRVRVLRVVSVQECVSVWAACLHGVSLECISL